MESYPHSLTAMTFRSFQTAPTGQFTTSGIWLGTDPALAVEPWGEAGPEPNAALVLESQAPLPKSVHDVPGLAATPVATLYTVFNKLRSAEAQHVLASIATTDGVYVSLLYAGRSDNNFGFGLNTYTNAGNALPGNPLDEQHTVLVRSKLYNPGPGGGPDKPFAMWLNGAPQVLRLNGIQQSHPWGNTFVLGGFLPGGPALDWQGEKYAARLYLADHTESQAQRTEAYLRAQYPAIT